MKEFYIGQDIVAIHNHPDGDFKEGDLFVIKDMTIECSCGLCINIGIIDYRMVGNVGKLSRCTICKSISIIKSEYVYFLSSWFKPLDTLVNISELTEVLNEPIFK